MRVIALVVLLFSMSCHKPTEPPPPKTALSLEAVDASCTEAWLKIMLDSGAQPRTVSLKRDSVEIFNIEMTGPDTLVIDEGLLPNHFYAYTASRPVGPFVERTTAAITTMDTTSHDWVFDTPVLLGDGSSSVLYDVAIINDTLAYAVGAIYKRDSLGNWDPNAYNMVKWDGNTWELIRIQFYTICGQIGSTPYPARSVFAFNANDIWISSQGGQLARWDGIRQTATICMPDAFAVNEIWGETPTSLYLVGYGGGIAHYRNGTWHRLQSGTTLPIMDVYGERDSRSGVIEVLCVSADPSIPGHSQVLAIENTTVHEVATHSEWEPWGIWFVPARRYVHAGDGLWESNSLNGPWVRNNNLPSLFKTSIRGLGMNDMVVCGAFFLLAHWNGVTWQTYLPRTSGSFTSVDLRNNLIVAVGGTGGRAVVVRGRR